MEVDSASRIKAVEELLSKLTAANESLTQDRDRECKKAKLLEQELLNVRKQSDELRRYQQIANGSSAEKTRHQKELQDAAELNNELREEVASLKAERAQQKTKSNGTNIIREVLWVLLGDGSCLLRFRGYSLHQSFT